MNDEWNNENSARSVFWTVVVIAAVVLAFIIVIASLSTPAHAQQPVSIIAPPVPAGDGVTASVTVAEMVADSDNAMTCIGVGVFLLVVFAGVVVYSIVNYRRRR
jgi:tellurite resistance protein TehA-like permease